jgi:cell division protein FtsA
VVLIFNLIQVNKLAMLPGEEIIHVLPQEFKIDGQSEIKEPIGMYGGRLEASFHVVVGQAASIEMEQMYSEFWN